MAKKSQTDGVKTIASMSHNRFGKAMLAIEQSSGILMKQEVFCAGSEGWHPDKDDVVRFFSDGVTTFVEPMGWQDDVPLNKKIEMALQKKDIATRRELLESTFYEPPMEETKKRKKADSSEE